jgi:hypothetical protein
MRSWQQHTGYCPVDTASLLYATALTIPIYEHLSLLRNPNVWAHSRIWSSGLRHPADWYLRTALFWVITQRVMVISFWDSWSLGMGPIGCPETSVRNYHYWLCNNPEDRSSRLLRSGSLKSHTAWWVVYRFAQRASPVLIQQTGWSTLKSPVPCIVFRSACSVLFQQPNAQY